MLCRQNQFGDKANFTLDLRVPAGMETLSVGDRLSKRKGPDQTEIHRWKAPRPYSPYLFGFAVGRFARVQSGQFVFLSDVADSQELSRRFAGTSDIANFMASKAGLPLPVGTYSQLLVPGSEAQEAGTYAVLGVDALPTNDNDPGENWAIAHEIAHQWWGNLVTCETLRDFWLNEGITTFMTAAWKEHHYGRNAYNAELDLARQRMERARAAGFDKPLTWAGKYPDLRTRRAVQYSKGALFMDHLRTRLGEGVFWRGLRDYTRKHAGGTVTSINLQRAMEAASGQNLQSLFNDWVYDAEA
jgi:aminopeptidase N